MSSPPTCSSWCARVSDGAGLGDRLRVWPQYLLPQHGLTALAHGISNSRWLARPMISLIRRQFNIALDDYQVPQQGFATFDEFFTRALKPGARPLPDDNHALVCPCDGRISELGQVHADTLVQAKGRAYSLTALLGESELADQLNGGQFMTVYLAPSDYHRAHMPFTGKLVRERRIPGRLFSVSDATVRVVDRLFARNERMVAVFDTEFGPAAVVMVAAMLVAGIETVWNPDQLRPGKAAKTREFSPGPALDRGDELGRFHWGSTVIVLTPPGAPAWLDSLSAGDRVQMGQALSQSIQRTTR